MNWRSSLLKAANSYCEETGRALSGLGATIMNDAKFFDRIESGAGCTMDTYQRVMEWFKQNPPQKLKSISKSHKAKKIKSQ